MKRLVIILVVFAGLAGLVGSSLLRGYLDQPLALAESAVTYTVPAGASLQQVAQQLGELNILQWPTVFSLWGRVTGTAGRIKAGEYQINAPATPRTLMQQLVEGKVIQHAFTILEGWTVRELLAELAGAEHLEHKLPEDARTKLATLLNLSADHPEGMFFPDTYQFPRGYSDIDVLRASAALMETRLTQAWDERDSDLPIESAYELLTLASIVERETGLDSERPDIAGVFIRRLRKGMLLQTDPTVIYGLGDDFDGNLTRRHLQTDTPYNTYTRRGLPPTPIGLPGEAALLAAAHPADGTALYFVARGDGSGGHAFSDTLEQHNAAVAQYLARLREARRSSASGGKP